MDSGYSSRICPETPLVLIIMLFLGSSAMLYDRRMSDEHRARFKEALIKWRDERAEQFSLRYFYIFPETEVGLMYALPFASLGVVPALVAAVLDFCCCCCCC